MFLQSAQQRRVGLAQRQRQVVQRYQQRRTGLGEAYRTAEEGLVVFHAGSVRQVVFQPDLVRRTFQVGDPARVEDPGSQDVLDHVAPYQGCLVAAVPDQPDLPAGRLDAAGAHVADQLLVGRDAAHGLAQGGAVHRDVAEHAPGAGLDETRRMQAEQGIAGMLAEIAEQALVGFARQALAIVVELVGLEAGGGQGRAMSRPSRSAWRRYFSRAGTEVEPRVCMVVVLVVAGGTGRPACVPAVLIGHRECLDPTVTGEGGWLV